MTEVPRVSVVIPAYNAASFLGSSLGSVNALEYPVDRLEVIVVDDGSIDNTAETATRILRDGPFEFHVTRQQNGGPSSARNAGWRMARGTWIQFLDADDRIACNKLTVQVAEALRAEHDVACLYSRWRCEHASGSPDGEGEVLDPDVEEDTVRRLLLGENFVPFGCTLVRRVWVERVGGFNEQRRLIEDVEFLLRLAMAGGRFRRVASASPLFTYTNRPGSLSRSSRSEFVWGCVRNARLAEEYWRGASTVLDETRVETLLAIYEEALRHFAMADREAFAEVWQDVHRVDPDFHPSNRRVTWLGKLIGVRNAYRIGVHVHRVRKRLN